MKNEKLKMENEEWKKAKKFLPYFSFVIFHLSFFHFSFCIWKTRPGGPQHITVTT